MTLAALLACATLQELGERGYGPVASVRCPDGSARAWDDMHAAVGSPDDARYLATVCGVQRCEGEEPFALLDGRGRLLREVGRGSCTR